MKHALLFATILMASVSAQAATMKELNSLKGSFKVPALPYAANALEAAIDAQTMTLHHDKHHQAYVDKLNEALPNSKEDLKTIMANVSTREAAVRNNAGGHWNHSFFWTVMSPKADEQKIPAKLEKELVASFGSLDKFKEAFEKAAAGQFGSGWAWLIRNDAGKLEITSTPNQDNPLMDVAPKKGKPLLAIDVWEHAYYLRYQNKRPDYLKNFWKVVNWKQVAAYDAEK
jgi:Fe-Mn family superoxide dismutase